MDKVLSKQEEEEVEEKKPTKQIKPNNVKLLLLNSGNNILDIGRVTPSSFRRC